MARKKKQTPEPPPENLDNTDDTFGLPEVEYQPLKRDEPETTDEPISQEEPPTHEAPAVVVINEAPQQTQEPEPEAPVETPTFQYRDEPIHEEASKENIFEEDRQTFDEDHQPYQPTYSYQRESPEIWPKVLGIILVIALVGLAVWYFASYRPEQIAKEERERKELQAIQEEARKKEEERQAAARRAEEERQKAIVAVPPTPAIGTIETLTGRSGRYYAVVASSIDGDLIMDYAKKLSAKGVSTKIIPPFGKTKFHRLAVAEGDTYPTTQATADGLKGGEYGDKVWVVKY